MYNPFLHSLSFFLPPFYFLIQVLHTILEPCSITHFAIFFQEIKTILSRDLSILVN